jgi:predicted Zn-dependent protease
MKFRAGIAVLTAFAMAAPAFAQSRSGGINLIRDAEIEHTIRAYTAPIFQAAALSTAKIEVHLVNDNRLNAFVAGGRHMFIHTGLLMRAEHAGQVIGVIAHETGHIVGGHLVRLHRELQDAQIKAILAMILSMGAAVVARDGRVVTAGTAMGQTIAERQLFQFARHQESAADAFALSALDRAGISSRGLYEFLQILGEQEMLYSAGRDLYVRTHPFTAARADEVRRHLTRSPNADRPLPKQLEIAHIRMRAKLWGFLRPLDQVIERYRGKENTLEARYALAVVYHRDAQLQKALQFIDSLVKEQPNDAYFHELRGQILFESGRDYIREAVAAYDRAVRLAPGEALIRVGLAQAQLATNDPRLEKAALDNLRAAMRSDDTYPLAWHLLSVAYGKAGDEGNAALANAEYAYLTSDLPLLRAAIPRAERGLKPGSPAWLRLQDLKSQVKQIIDDRRR